MQRRTRRVLWPRGLSRFSEKPLKPRSGLGGPLPDRVTREAGEASSREWTIRGTLVRQRSETRRVFSGRASSGDLPEGPDSVI